MVDTVAESIIAEVGGPESARVLFKGKIVGVERVLRMGHAYGEVTIESTTGDANAAKEHIIIPFKNENIYAKKEDANGKGEVSLAPLHKMLPLLMDIQILAIVPDLICVLDAHNGEALGTQEYRYGLPVIVLGITASEKWTSTARGLKIGGPKGFGFDDLEYKPLGKFSKPHSVIDEFDTLS